MHGSTITRADWAALENLWGEAGTWAAETWTSHNAAYFGGQLHYHGAVFGLTPHGRRLGHTSRTSGRITLHPSLLDPQGNAWALEPRLGVRFASDVLLHEMIHAHLFDGGDLGEESHNSEGWCVEITRLTPLLGLDPIHAEPVRQHRVDGKVTRWAREGYLPRNRIADWPHSLRPARYYEADPQHIRVPI